MKKNTAVKVTSSIEIYCIENGNFICIKLLDVLFNIALQGYFSNL